MKTTSQSSKRQIRNEIQNEIQQALAINVERGTVVTSAGNVIKFRVETLYGARYIHICGYVMRNAKEAAAAAMLSMGYTRS